MCHISSFSSSIYISQASLVKPTTKLLNKPASETAVAQNRWGVEQLRRHYPMDVSKELFTLGCTYWNLVAFLSHSIIRLCLLSRSYLNLMIMLNFRRTDSAPCEPSNKPAGIGDMTNWICGKCRNYVSFQVIDCVAGTTTPPPAESACLGVIIINDILHLNLNYQMDK